VVAEGNAPTAGVVVQLLDSTSSIVAHTLSGPTGEFRITAPRDGTFRLRTLRIGFHPVVSDPIVLRSGSEVAQRLALTGVPFLLDTVRVAGHAVCRSFGDSAAMAYMVWDQARAALIAAQLTAASRAVFTRTVVYQRALDPGGDRVRSDSTSIRSGFMSQPWLALAPDSLRRVGYVVPDQHDAIVYYAPGLDVLLSRVFVEDHCFHLVQADRRIGIAFEPTPNRRRIAEIKGTLWLDRATVALKELQFGYVNVLPEQEANARGSMQFARMADGTWAIAAWNIQMPVTRTNVLSQRYGGPEIQVVEIQVAGGELALATRGGDTLWSHERVPLDGSVVDSSSGTPIPNARLAFLGTSLRAVADTQGRFQLAGALPGEYQLEVRTASLDSVGAVYQTAVTLGDSVRTVVLRVPAAREIAAMFCGARGIGSGGVILGQVTRPPRDSIIARGTQVTADWQTLSIRDGGSVIGTASTPHTLSAKTDSHGLFRLCGLPLNTRVTVSASTNGASARPVDVTIPSSGRFAHTDLVLDATLVPSATFTGIVVVDSTNDPVVGAEVGVTALGLSTSTDDHGAFRLTGIAPGQQQVVIRRIGYGPVEAQLTFAAGQSLRRTVHMGRATVLDSVIVTDRMTDRALADFEDNRRLGLGHFLTREDLKPLEGVSTAGALATMPGIAFVRAGPYAWVQTSRATSDRGGALPDRGYQAKGALLGCYAVVYVDNLLVFANKRLGTPPRLEPLFDINSIPVSEIEAIEYYASPAETPMQYNILNATCGVLVIHTLRFHPSDTMAAPRKPPAR
jgi:hypothetical protein